jgi:hypothetical protein
LNELSNKLGGKDYNKLLNIGLSIGVQYDKIESGEEIPYNTEDNNKHYNRLIIIKKHINNLVLDYNKFKNNKNLNFIEYNLHNLIKEFQPSDFEKLKDMSDFLDASKISEFENASIEGDIRYIKSADFALSTLVDTLLNMFNSGGLYKRFIEFYVNKIYEYEFLISKPLNYHLIRSININNIIEKKNVENNEFGADFGADFEEEAVDESGNMVEIDIEDEGAALYSFANVDYDDADDEDNATEVE